MGTGKLDDARSKGTGLASQEAQVRIFVGSADRDVEFVVPYLTNDVSLLEFTTVLTARSSIQKTDFPGGVIKPRSPVGQPIG